MSFELEVTSDLSPKPGDSQRTRCDAEAQAVDYLAIGVFGQRPQEEAQEEEFCKVGKERHRHGADRIEVSS